VGGEFGRDWIQRFKGGDPAAFDELFRSLSGKVYGFLLRMTQRQDVAQDLLQETWVRVASHSAGVRDDTRIGPWVFTIARNLAVSFHRSRLLEDERITQYSFAHYRGSAVTPFETVSADQTVRCVERAIGQLPLRYREVLLLVVVEGMAPAAAAEVLGLKPAAVRKRLQRAREMIADEVGAPSAEREGTA
jgi:RNA polymerase sigma-70 factor (ECF subfamily)